jgi:hypothetical protein
MPVGFVALGGTVSGHQVCATVGLPGKNAPTLGMMTAGVWMGGGAATLGGVVQDGSAAVGSGLVGSG